jgi:hypothetical protein
MVDIKIKKSSVSGKVPTISDLDYGELAINYADGRLFYKNSLNLIKNFIDSDAINIIVDNKLAEAGVGDSNQVINLIQLNSVDSAEVIALIDSDYVRLRETYSTSSDLLEALKLVDGPGSGLNADLLDSQEGAYFLDYNNFTNTPNILDSSNVRNIFSTDGDINYNSTTGEFSVTTYKSLNFDSDFAFKSTTDLTEGVNLYYTKARVDSDVQQGIDALIDEAPNALNTLNKLAAALGDDANFSTTITNQIAALPDSSEVSAIIIKDVDKAFVDALNVNADTLDGQEGAYYLDYNNFINVPDGADSASIKNIIDSDYIINDVVYQFPVNDFGLVTESTVDAFGAINVVLIDLMETPLPFNQTKMYDFGSVAA